MVGNVPKTEKQLNENLFAIHTHTHATDYLLLLIFSIARYGRLNIFVEESTCFLKLVNIEESQSIGQMFIADN